MYYRGKSEKIFSNQFVLCCGGIENSRILLWTKFNNKDLLKNNNIGKYWMTHYWILGGVGFIDLKNFKFFMKEKFIDREGVIHIGSNEKNLNNNFQTGLYFSTNEDLNFIKEMVKSILCTAPEYGKKISKFLLNKSLKCGNIFMHLEEEPIFENQISLDETNKDPNGIPLPKIRYKSSLESKKNAKQQLEKLANFFKKENLGRIAMSDDLYNLKEFENLGNYHHMGGTRIGDSTKDSVVDKDFKVHGVNNLYVSGSSNYRYGTYKNPTFTIIQYSIKLADNLKKINLMIKKKNIFNLFILILFILIVFKVNFLKSLHNLILSNYDNRISKVYGFCDREGIGYVNFIKKNFEINGKIKIQNSLKQNNNNSGKWSVYNTNYLEKTVPKYLILINHKKFKKNRFK